MSLADISLVNLYRMEQLRGYVAHSELLLTIMSMTTYQTLEQFQYHARIVVAG